MTVVTEIAAAVTTTTTTTATTTTTTTQASRPEMLRSPTLRNLGSTPVRTTQEFAPVH